MYVIVKDVTDFGKEMKTTMLGVRFKEITDAESYLNEYIAKLEENEYPYYLGSWDEEFVYSHFVDDEGFEKVTYSIAKWINGTLYDAY